MNQTEVIGPEIERHGSLQIGQLAGECQGETVESSNLHPKRQILPFNVGRTDLAVIRDAQNLGDLRSRYAGRRVATRARILGRVKLSDLCIGGSMAEVTTNSWTIRPPRIGTDLRGPFNSMTQILDESMCIDESRLPTWKAGMTLETGSSAM